MLRPASPVSEGDNHTGADTRVVGHKREEVVDKQAPAGKRVATGRPAGVDTPAGAAVDNQEGVDKPAGVGTAGEEVEVAAVAGGTAVGETKGGGGGAARLPGLLLPCRRIRKNGRCLPGCGRNRCKNVETCFTSQDPN